MKDAIITVKKSINLLKALIMARRKTDKTRKQYSIDPGLVKLVQHEAVTVGCFDSAVIEKALVLYFRTKYPNQTEQLSVGVGA